jgi:hypothetical protein
MHMARRISLFLLLVIAGNCVACAARADSEPVVAARAEQPVIVIGLVGGWIHSDNRLDRMVQLAARLNEDYGRGVHAEIFENHHRVQARERILELLDADRDGTLAVDEKQNARIVLYGESWGGSEMITLARELEARGIPVLLTVQIDSVAKAGENDELTPANVAQAANFYQPHGIIHGRQEIRAADSSRTQIIGNFRSDYRGHPMPGPGASWFARTFFKPHVSIENDPAVWTRIEKLIRSKLPAPAVQPQKTAGLTTEITE